MTHASSVTALERSMLSLPILWPMEGALGGLTAEAALAAKSTRFVEEETKIAQPAQPVLATPNQVRLNLRTMTLRDYGTPDGLPTLIDAPHAGHHAMIADYGPGQSLVQALLSAGICHVALTDWKPASEDMKDLEIDNYLADMVVAIDDLGGRVNLVGLCQGDWVSAMIAARFPEKVNRLVLAGAPIDTDAGDGPIKRIAHETPISVYRNLVELGGGVMKGALMLDGWKNMHPEQHYFQNFVDLYDHIDDPGYLAKEEAFARWYENPMDLPGRWYLQVITQIFKQNRLAKGRFIALGRTLDLRNLVCPTYLLAGADDDITTPEQVLNAVAYIGTPPRLIVSETVPGGHIGLFMGARTLKEHWPKIAAWIQA